MLTEKLTALNAYVTKEDKSKISNINFHLRKLEKEKQYKPKQAEKKKYIYKEKINEIENRKSIEEIN